MSDGQAHSRQSLSRALWHAEGTVVSDMKVRFRKGRQNYWETCETPAACLLQLAMMWQFGASTSTWVACLQTFEPLGCWFTKTWTDMPRQRCFGRWLCPSYIFIPTKMLVKLYWPQPTLVIPHFYTISWCLGLSPTFHAHILSDISRSTDVDATWCNVSKGVQTE